MAKKILISVFLIINFLFNANCAGIFLCTSAYKVGCSEKPGGWTLLPPGPKCYPTSGHISGYAIGKSGCYIYSSSGCTGTQEFVDQAGWSRFPFTPLSYKCQDML
ncbi:unnamed protein product [Brachionus calyciflorus]|uniref:Secreted protein n=1 Tax=Brachionus calyciflorus TaxID=104777 RepID=A0A814A8Y5_9BILA|nr:unnamed protein product [Brachionus calyciflorus]